MKSELATSNQMLELHILDQVVTREAYKVVSENLAIQFTNVHKDRAKLRKDLEEANHVIEKMSSQIAKKADISQV